MNPSPAVTLQLTKANVALMLDVAEAFDPDMEFKLSHVGLASYLGISSAVSGCYTWSTK